MQTSSGQTAHQREEPAVPFLPDEQKRQHQHGCQQNQISKSIGDGGIQPFLRVVVDGRFAQTGIHRCCDLDVFQIVPGLIVLENRDACQLSCLGLHAFQKVGVPGHRVILIHQLSEQTVFHRQAIGVERVALVAVHLFVLVEQGGIFLPVILLNDAVAIR